MEKLHAERATTSEVRVWLDEATLEARTHTSDRVSHVAAALQRLNDAMEEDRAQAASEAGDYTPHQLQVLHTHVTSLHPYQALLPLKLCDRAHHWLLSASRPWHVKFDM